MSTDGSGQIRTRIRPEYWGEDSRVSDETVKPGLPLTTSGCLPHRPSVRPLTQPRLSSDESNTREKA